MGDWTVDRAGKGGIDGDIGKGSERQLEAECPPVDLKIFGYQCMEACLCISRVTIDQDTGCDTGCRMRDAGCGMQGGGEGEIHPGG